MTLRAAVVGLGVGEQHIFGYAAHPDCVPVAICDTDPAKLATVGERHPQLRRTLSPAEIFADPEIDVVSIASPDDVHHEQVAAALRAGKHVFVEKPLCLGREECDDLWRLLAERPALHLSSNLILRYSPRFLTLRRRIRDGGLGRIYQIEGDYNYGRLHKLTEGWRGSIPFYSIVLGGGIHLIDLMMWLAGRRIVEVAAFGSRICTEGTGFRFPDASVAVLRFEDGAIGKLAANFGCVYPHFHRLSVYGTAATFENDPSGGRLFTSRDPAVPWEAVSDPYPGVRKGDSLADFIDAILGRKPPVIPADEVFASMSAGLAIEEAMQTGRTVAVPVYPPLGGGRSPAAPDGPRDDGPRDDGIEPKEG